MLYGLEGGEKAIVIYRIYDYNIICGPKPSTYKIPTKPIYPSSNKYYSPNGWRTKIKGK